MKGATYGKGIFLHRRFWNSFRMILWPLFWLKYVPFFFFFNETCYLESGVMELNVVQEMQTDSCYNKTPFPQRNTTGGEPWSPQWLCLSASPLLFAHLHISSLFFFKQWTCTACITKTLKKFSKIKEKKTHKGILCVAQPKVPENGNRHSTKKRSSDEVTWKTSS